jgi:hypothetical protein
MAGQYKNVFWIGANILFDLGTGATSQVLLLVYREEDASTFTKQQADLYLSFVKARGAHIVWEIKSSTVRRELFVIRGEQDV